MTQEDLVQYLQPTSIIDSDHPSIRDLAKQIAGNIESTAEKAIGLYNWVRDEIIYDPYSPFHKTEHYRASEVLKRRRGFCVPKASLLCALARAQSIPCRLGFADVRNHLATKRFLERLGSDLFVYHGYVEFFLNGRWIKASPTFHRELCVKFGVPPLEFDGVHDAVFQAYAPPLDEVEMASKGGLLAGESEITTRTNREPRRFMEYVAFHGTRADVPIDEILSAWEKAYGKERVNKWIEETEQHSK
ncbi:MAG: transglutaminase-like domain-containing protein [Thermodesulforhabdaceae bacterium]